jgi:hypothetical protein
MAAVEEKPKGSGVDELSAERSNRIVTERVVVCFLYRGTPGNEDGFASAAQSARASCRPLGGRIVAGASGLAIDFAADAIDDAVGSSPRIFGGGVHRWPNALTS